MTLRKGDRVPRVIWRSLDPMAKLVHLANGHVAIDDEGYPVLASEALASVVGDVDRLVREAVI
jgi:hypothetical protein